MLRAFFNLHYRRWTRPGQDAPDAKPRVFQSLECHPAQFQLNSLQDARRFLVTGITADGQKIDLTSTATASSTAPCITVDSDGYISPVAAGQGQLVIEAAGLKLEVPVTVSSANPVPVDFIRDVNPLLSKVGCNQGTCHGSANGRNGFKLSLRGYDSLYDYRSLIDDISGRRFNRSVPSQSLMLLKPTQGCPTKVGFCSTNNHASTGYSSSGLLKAATTGPTAARVVGIDIYPPTPLLQLRHDKQQLVVTARYADGSTRDVTRDAVFDTSNFEVATVSRTGLITAVQRG
ncbi:MAG UNVERIFIED_CONTAM: Ig-like domain-containing protein [Planctomycetaceae bacterium]